MTPGLLDSYNPTKVKSIVRMALSRIGQQKAKTLNLVKSQQRSIAELLQAGKYDSARIRVEGCIRDDDSQDGYEALGILLEILAARAQTIEDSASAPLIGKSNPSTMCPPELKEAVTSVVWASGVLGERIPELVSLSKMIGSKYGKEFVKMSLDNSDLSVNETLLSRFAVSPPPQGKCLQYLRTVAKEYDVEIDEAKLSDDPNEMGAILGGGMESKASCEGAIHTRSGLSIPPMTVVRDDLDQRLDFLRLS